MRVCFCLCLRFFVCICVYAAAAQNIPTRMCMHVYACVCMCMYVYVCVCMGMYVYVCVCMCMYVYVYVCVCVFCYYAVKTLKRISGDGNRGAESAVQHKSSIPASFGSLDKAALTSIYTCLHIIFL